MEFWIFVILLTLGVLILYRHKFYDEWHELRTAPRTWLKKIWKEWGEPFLIAAAIALVIRTFVLGPYKIPSGSMRPTLLEGDRIFVDKLTYRFRTPKRGEIIVFKYPLDPKKDFVKRLIAFGGEKIKIDNGIAYVNGVPLDHVTNTPPHYYYNREDWQYGRAGQVFEVPRDSYFVLGDNSAQSSDSRNWGFVPMKSLVGRALVIWWPLSRVRLVE